MDARFRGHDNLLLLGRAGHVQQIRRPWHCRFAPDLPLRRQLGAFRQRTDAKIEDFGIFSIGGVDRRAATPAKSLGPAIAVFCRFDIAHRLAAQDREILGFARRRGAECGAGKTLTVTAMTDRDAGWVDLTLPGDSSAMT